MQRGSAWPTFSPHTTGSAGSSITCRSSCSYSACHTPSIGRPTSTPLTAANTPASFRYSSAFLYFAGAICSSLDSSSRILPCHSSFAGNSPYFRQISGMSA